MDKHTSICIECKRKFIWYFSSDPFEYKDVYNTGVGNDQMCLQCAEKKGFLNHWMRRNGEKWVSKYKGD